MRWSDGSLSLQVGAELFDISATVDHSALLSSAAATPLIPSSHAPELNNFNPSRQHGLTYLTAKHGYTSLTEAQASVHGTLTFRPTTLHSATHRRLAGTVNTQHAKTRAIRMAAVPERDPEREKAEREKAEEDRARKAKREQQKAAGGVRRKLGARPGTRMVGGSDDEDEEGGSDGGVYERREMPRRNTNLEDDYDEDGFVVGSDEEEERTGGGRGDQEVSSTRPSRLRSIGTIEANRPRLLLCRLKRLRSVSSVRRDGRRIAAGRSATSQTLMRMRQRLSLRRRHRGGE